MLLFYLYLCGRMSDNFTYIKHPHTFGNTTSLRRRFWLSSSDLVVNSELVVRKCRIHGEKHFDGNTSGQKNTLERLYCPAGRMREMWPASYRHPAARVFWSMIKWHGEKTLQVWHAHEDGLGLFFPIDMSFMKKKRVINQADITRSVRLKPSS